MGVVSGARENGGRTGVKRERVLREVPSLPHRWSPYIGVRDKTKIQTRGKISAVEPVVAPWSKVRSGTCVSYSLLTQPPGVISKLGAGLKRVEAEFTECGKEIGSPVSKSLLIKEIDELREPS